MCIQEGFDMGGRIRGLGTSESWFSLCIQGNIVVYTLMEDNTYFGRFCVGFA
jgi:hypothetical protein